MTYSDEFVAENSISCRFQKVIYFVFVNRFIPYTTNWRRLTWSGLIVTPKKLCNGFSQLRIALVSFTTNILKRILSLLKVLTKKSFIKPAPKTKNSRIISEGSKSYCYLRMVHLSTRNEKAPDMGVFGELTASS